MKSIDIREVWKQKEKFYYTTLFQRSTFSKETSEPKNSLISNLTKQHQNSLILRMRCFKIMNIIILLMIWILIFVVQFSEKEYKTAVTKLEKERKIFSAKLLCSENHSQFTVQWGSYNQKNLCAVHVKHTSFECSLCWETFFKDEVNKNLNWKPTVAGKALSSSQSW